MVTVTAWKDAKKVTLFGHGLKVENGFEYADGVTAVPEVPELDQSGLEDDMPIVEQAAITTMHEMATFVIDVVDENGGKALATRAWNRLWDFHLLSLASKSPAFILFSASSGAKGTTYSVTNRNLILNPLAETRTLGDAEFGWVKEYEPNFRDLIKVDRFSAAMRYFGNAHYLFDLDHRIMLLWAGIEGLLQVEAEHSHRIALYSAILSHGADEEKLARLKSVKAAYGLRSRVVHGAKPKQAKLEKGYAEATDLLATLLARCVELGRVPERNEFDQTILKAAIL